MKFAAIAPTKVLRDIGTGLYCRPLQFCLAHVYKQGGQYAGWYKEQVQMGKEVILDNGEHELQRVGFLEYWACIQDLQPAVAVLPDKQENHYYTRKLHREFLAFAALRPRGEWRPHFMTVLHAEGEETWELVHQYIQCDTPWIGFPNNISDCHGPEGRVTLAKQLKICDKWKPAVKHHALGWNGDSYSEWGLLAREGFYSCDSSNPIWRKALGHKQGDINYSWAGDYDPSDVKRWVGKVDGICGAI